MDVELDRKQDVLSSSNVVLTGVEGVPTVSELLPEPQEQLTGHRSGPSYRARYILSGHSLSIASVKFSPDGSLLASCGKPLINWSNCGTRIQANLFIHSKDIQKASQTLLGRAMVNIWLLHRMIKLS